MLSSRDRATAGGKLDLSSNVGVTQAVRLARPTTKAPETQIYFITHRSGANSVPRVRTVVRGERASRSIVNRTTAFWFIWVVVSLILAGLGLGRYLDKREVPKTTNPRGFNGVHDHASWVFNRPKWNLPL